MEMKKQFSAIITALLAFGLCLNGFAEPEYVADHRTKATAGDASSQNILGVIYTEGSFGFAKDSKEAVKWWRKAAVRGHSYAQFNLGHTYAFGEGILQDDKEGAKWIRKAAEQGHVQAQGFLGIMYTKGGAVPRNLQEAIKWFRKAGVAGDVPSMFALGGFFSIGAGTPQDSVRGYAWLHLCVYHGQADGVELRDALARTMTPEQIAKAQELSKELLKRIEENKKKS